MYKKYPFEVKLIKQYLMKSGIYKKRIGKESVYNSVRKFSPSLKFKRMRVLTLFLNKFEECLKKNDFFCAK